MMVKLNFVERQKLEDILNSHKIITRFYSVNYELSMLRAGLQGGETACKWTEKSFLVPKDEIKSNDYDLSINRYKVIVHDEVKYDSHAVILDRVAELEKGIVNRVEELWGMVG